MRTSAHPEVARIVKDLLKLSLLLELLRTVLGRFLRKNKVVYGACLFIYVDRTLVGKTEILTSITRPVAFLHFFLRFVAHVRIENRWVDLFVFERELLQFKGILL